MTRARRRIWQETLVSAKRRVAPLVVSLVGLGLGYIYAKELGQIATWQTVAIAIGSGISATIVWILGVLIVNTLRVPWLLDAESGQLIDVLETRAEAAEEVVQDKKENECRHELFGTLMSEGQDLYDAFNMGAAAGQQD